MLEEFNILAELILNIRDIKDNIQSIGIVNKCAVYGIPNCQDNIDFKK